MVNSFAHVPNGTFLQNFAFFLWRKGDPSTEFTLSEVEGLGMIVALGV